MLCLTLMAETCSCLLCLGDSRRISLRCAALRGRVDKKTFSLVSHSTVDSQFTAHLGKDGPFKLLVYAFMPWTLSDVYELSPATHYEPRPPVWCP